MRRCGQLIAGFVLPALLGSDAFAQTPPPSYPIWRPNGRLQADVAFYDQDRNPLSNGAQARRARLAMAGDLSERLHFQLEIDLADDDARLRDAWLLYNLTPWARLHVGNFKSNISLESLTSSLYISFLERSLLDEAFIPPRQLGVVLRGNSAPFFGAIGLHANEVGAETGPDLQESQPIGVSLRGGVAPWHEPRRVFHVGAAARHRTRDVEDDDTLVVQFEALSETHVDDTELYNTGPISEGRSYGQLQAEAAIVYGSVSLQGEYLWTQVNRSVLEEPVFNGGYAFVSFFPTGESRLYDVTDGRFIGITAARHKYGAVELLLRYSQLDLNDVEVTGGAGHDWTIGLNWYPHRQVRTLFNYVFTNHDLFATGDGEFLGNDDFGVFQFRVQYNF